MMVLSRCLVSLGALLAGAEGFRKKFGSDLHSSPSTATKVIAGVPVFNYETVHDGISSLSELNADTPREWVLVVKASTSDETITTICEAAPDNCNLAGRPSAGGVPFLELRATEQELNSAVLAANGAVRYIEPDQEVQLLPDLTVEAAAAAWGLERIGTHLQSSTGSGTTIFVVDTGVRTSHNEFREGASSRAAPAVDITVPNKGVVVCNGDLSCAADADGHGTHCAATAAGRTYGVAPQAKVMGVKVLNDQGNGEWSWTYSALDWIARNPQRPSVASMSLGGGGTQEAMKDAIDTVVAQGVVVVVAAGNSNSDACSFTPAYVPSAITVGSITQENARSGFSNYGSCTNIWAPGSNVVSASHRSDTAARTLSGTSMACPHVSGAAALLLQDNPFALPWTILAEMTRGAAVGWVTGLKANDINVLLHVGDGDPPAARTPPTPPKKNCPWWTFGLC